jgi:hypothetical protein
MWTRTFLGVCALTIGALAPPAPASERLERAQVPASLYTWVDWVLYDNEEALCPRQGGERVCAWPGHLTLELDERGGSFTQTFEVFVRGLAALPGDARRWPLDVTVDKKPAAVMDAEGGPRVQLAPGRHTVSGRFVWDRMPESLVVPLATGLVSLRVRGQGVTLPQRQGTQVFLARQELPDEADSLDIAVHRKLIDDVPLLLVTRLSLSVGGKSREVLLGRALPDDFIPVSIDSTIPTRIEPDGGLRVQARAGQHVLEITARRPQKTTSVTRPAPKGAWKEGQEAWVFEARPALRVVDVEGVPPIDPRQTTLPPEWQNLPAYAVDPGATVTLTERRRGDTDATADRMALSRRLWLDFDGGGYTFEDTITARFETAWRLEMGRDLALGRVAVGDEDQFITRTSDGRDGVEVRVTDARIKAESRLADDRRRLSAVGWNHDFDSATLTFNVPPGWSLLHAAGPDDVSGSWLDRWSLMDLFLLLVTALAVGKLFGWRLGLIAFWGLGLTLTERNAPAATWVAVLVAEALARAVRAGKIGTALRWARAGTWVVLLVVLVPFLVWNVRVGLHPAAGTSSGRSANLLDVGLPGTSAPMRAADEGNELPERLAAKVAPTATSPGIGAEEGSAPLEETIDLQRRSQGFLGNSVDSVGGAKMRKGKRATQNLAAYDPSMVVQTGPGLPRWIWNQAHLGFNGPVTRDQHIRLFLIPPFANMALSLARALLLALLAYGLLRRPLRFGTEWRPPPPFFTAALVVILVAGLVSVRPAHAQSFPPENLLNELRARLLKEPACAPDCASLDRLQIEANPRTLRFAFEVSASAATALPLPASPGQWEPTDVQVDARPTESLARDATGRLWVLVPAGKSRVLVQGPPPSRTRTSLSLSKIPRHTTARLDGFTLAGLHEDGQVDGSLELERARAKGAASTPEELETGTLPPFLEVERTITLALKWTVITRVSKRSPSASPVVIDIPLIAGEAVNTPGVRISPDGGKATVTLEPSVQEVAWTSTLSETTNLRLTAPDEAATTWTELWRLEIGSTWHAEVAGLAPIGPAGDDQPRARVFRPWPGESVRVSLSKPAGATGRTLTVDASELIVSPGPRATDARLEMDLRASRATRHPVTLPPGAVLQSVKLAGQTNPLRLENGRVVLPVQPGAQHVSIMWRQPTGLGLTYRTPVVDLGGPATNASVTVQVPDRRRWILWLSGPRLGPAVFFWSLALVLAALGVALGRTRLAPLAWWDWLLLGLGLAQVDVWSAALVAGLFLALGWRARANPSGKAWRHDGLQLVFVVWTVVALAVLLGAIQTGLLATPDMRVAGYGAWGDRMTWFADQIDGPLPRALVVSAPILSYRIAMLVWALWLAVAVIKWSRWAWASFKVHGLWMPLGKPKVAPPAAGPTP